MVMIVCGGALPAQGASLGLLWTFPRDAHPAPDAFILTVTQAGTSPQQFRVPLAAAGACTQMPAGTPAEFCTQLSCPPPGTIAGFWVQAI